MTVGAVLVGCLRDEAPFLIEWLAFHKALGFGHAIIGANNCTDESDQMLQRLAQLGELTYMPFSRNDDEGPQETYERMLADAAPFSQGQWVCWLDMDEFLNIHLGSGQLGELTQAMGQAQGIRVNWRLFGAKPDTAWPGRQIHADLCECSATNYGATGAYQGNRTFKSLARFEQGMRITPHGPVLDQACAARKPRWLNGSGKDVRSHAWPYLRKPLKAGQKPTNLRTAPAHDWAQINHYATRHPILTQMRRQRGRGSGFVPSDPRKPGADDWSARHSDAYFERINRTEARDTSILKYQDQLDAAMARLLSDKALMQLHGQAQDRLNAVFENQ